MRKEVILVTLLLMVTFASALLGDFGNYVKGEEVRIKQVCDDATYINISSITYPNSSTAASNIAMTGSGSGEFFYTFTDTNTLGRYYVNGISDGCDGVFAFYFEVTSLGEEFTIQIALAYGMGIFFLLIMILGVWYVTSRLPGDDARDERNLIIQVSQLKNFRIVGYMTIYALVTAIVYIFSNFALAYLKQEFVGSFFFMIFQVMMLGLLIFLPLSIIWLIWKFYKDKEFQSLINRGVMDSRF